MPEPRDRHRPEEPKEKAPDFQEFRLLDEDDGSYFRKTFAGRVPLETCIAAIRERGYRDADIPVLIMKFGNDVLRDAVLERIDEYPKVDIVALLHAVPWADDFSEHTVMRHIALRLEQYAAQDRFAERMLEHERSCHFFIVNLSHLHDLSPEVARRLIDQGYRWAVLGHLSSFQPNSVDIPVLISDMVVNSEMSEEVAQELVDALSSPEHFAVLLSVERRSLLGRMCHAGQRAAKEKDARLSHEQAQKEFFLQAVPDRALFIEYSRYKGIDAAREAMYQIYAMHQSSLLTRDVPGIMEDLFLEEEAEFFRTEQGADFSSALFAIEKLKQGHASQYLYETQCAIWSAEESLLMNYRHVQRRIDVFAQLSDHDRALPEEEQKFSEAVNVLTLAAMSQRTVFHYLPLAKTVMEHPDFFLRVPLGQHDTNHLLRRDAVGFFEAYAEMFQEGDEGANFFLQVFLSVDPDSALYNFAHFANATKAMVCAWHGEQRQYAAEKVLDFLDNGKEERMPLIYAYLLYCSEQDIRDRVLSYFHCHGLPFLDHSLIETWRRCSSKADGPDKMLGEIRAIMRLEKARPGACVVLRKEFGIENFSRYPFVLLQEQYDTRDDHSLPFGVVINPKTDYSSAFQSVRTQGGSGKDPIYEIDRQIQGECRLRLYEAGSTLDVVRALNKIKKRYILPSGHKISFALIGGHGTQTSIQFGDGEFGAMLTVDDLIGEGVARLGGAYFEPRATVILRSCSTGVTDGIGQQLSAVLGLRVIAPDVPTNIQDITVSFDQNGQIQFRVQFFEGNSTEYEAGVGVGGNDNPSP